jgi:2-polyprenyl-6-methoxyphenol hydroxylase-like FAD-dependent oxidoreductase
MVLAWARASIPRLSTICHASIANLEYALHVAHSPRTALIVGAGIGGLAAAISLRRAGWAVRVFERAESPRALGFALALMPNAVAALRELGVADRVIASGSVFALGELRRADGRLLRRIDTARGSTDDAFAVVALRSVLHGALLDAVGTDTLTLSREGVGFESVGPRVRLYCAGGAVAEGDVLIGADGVASVIRRSLHPAEPAPRRSGYVALRGVAFGAGHHLGPLRGAGFFGPGVEAATTRANDTDVYWYMSLLAPDVPAGISARALLAERSAGFDPMFQAITGGTRAEDLRLDELFDREPLAVWGRGPVTLLGDAAHPMLPHAGQGAAQALEDAVALGLAIGAGGDLESALRRY